MDDVDKDRMEGIADKERVQEWVREAVGDALSAANIIDGPTHIKHHQILQEFCDTYSKVKTTSITVLVATFIGGVITIVVLGFRAWIKGSS